MMSSGPRNGPPRRVLEAAADPVELVQVDAGHGVDAADGLDHGAGGQPDVRLLQERRPAASPASQAELRLIREVPGARTMMSAPTPRARSRRVLQHALAEAHQRQHHGHFDADGQHAQQRPHRPVLQVFEYQFVDQVASIVNRLRAGSTATGSAASTAAAR